MIHINIYIHLCIYGYAAAAAAKLLKSCPTLGDPIDGSPPGSPVPGILQARTQEWVAISFSSAWKWKVKVKSLSRVRLLATPWTAAYQAPPSMGFFQARVLEWGAIDFSNIYACIWASQVALLVKNQSANAGDLRDLGLIPGLKRSSGGAHGNSLQYSCLENPTDREAWQTIVHRVAESDTISDLAHMHTCLYVCWYLYTYGYINTLLQIHTNISSSYHVPQYLFWFCPLIYLHFFLYQWGNWP